MNCGTVPPPQEPSSEGFRFTYTIKFERDPKCGYLLNPVDRYYEALVSDVRRVRAKYYP